ncbi:MAG: hypothetical protein PF495_14200, partial [Spirochaetales bacterium]|nr:hypothetical protein [Spirochaetales bacterium]
MSAFDLYTGLGDSYHAEWGEGVTVAVAVADHADTLRSIKKMHQTWGAKGLLFGDKDRILRIAESIGFSVDRDLVVDEPDHERACAAAVDSVVHGKSSI